MSDRITDSLAEALSSLTAQSKDLDGAIAELRATARRLAAILPRRRRAAASVKRASKVTRRGQGKRTVQRTSRVTQRRRRKGS